MTAIKNNDILRNDFDLARVDDPKSEDFMVLPGPFVRDLMRFVLDKRTGNVRLNIRDGKILGYSVEQLESLRMNGMN